MVSKVWQSRMATALTAVWLLVGASLYYLRFSVQFYRDHENEIQRIADSFF